MPAFFSVFYHPIFIFLWRELWFFGSSCFFIASVSVRVFVTSGLFGGCLMSVCAVYIHVHDYLWFPAFSCVLLFIF